MRSASTPTRCAPPRPEVPASHADDRYARLGIEAMGCRFEIMIAVPRTGHDRYSCAAVARELGELISDWHNRLTVFSPHSIASRINRCPAGVAIPIDRDMLSLCLLCDRLRRRTGGAFNIAAGTLMHTHGFRGDPTDADLSALDLDHAIQIDQTNLTITRTDERVSLDFGAIAKGFVLDLVRQELEEHGIAHAFVHGGTSSVLAMGLDACEHAWAVRTGDSAPHDFHLSDLALGVSQHGSRVVDRDGRTLGHIMNPRTGAPAENAVTLVACAHASAAVADAYSTALSVDPGLADTLSADQCSVLIIELGRRTLHDTLGVITRPDLHKELP